MEVIQHNNLKQQLIDLLSNHRGRERAIKRRYIRQLLGLPISKDRRLRVIISELRHDGYPILMNTHAPAGYYLPSKPKELTEGLEALRSYIIDECMILRKIKVKGEQYILSEHQVRFNI